MLKQVNFSSGSIEHSQPLAVLSLVEAYASLAAGSLRSPAWTGIIGHVSGFASLPKQHEESGSSSTEEPGVFVEGNNQDWRDFLCGYVFDLLDWVIQRRCNLNHYKCRSGVAFRSCRDPEPQEQLGKGARICHFVLSWSQNMTNSNQVWIADGALMYMVELAFWTIPSVKQTPTASQMIQVYVSH